MIKRKHIFRIKLSKRSKTYNFFKTNVIFQIWILLHAFSINISSFSPLFPNDETFNSFLFRQFLSNQTEWAQKMNQKNHIFQNGIPITVLNNSKKKSFFCSLVSRKRKYLSGNENLVGDRKTLELLQSVKTSFLVRRSFTVNGSGVCRFLRRFEQLNELFLHRFAQKL